jgi:hypothetical protein
MTPEQKAVHFDTWQHIHEVRKLLTRMQEEIGRRALDHDQSKIQDPAEMEVFAEFTPKLHGVTFGSDEYKGFLRDMGPAVQSHQLNNRHHPEAHEGGVSGMNLIDILEMVCDWKAASLRHANGNFSRSVELCSERFNIAPQLAQIIMNTAALFEVQNE